MKLRVVYARSSYKGRTYTCPLVQYSYRDNNGTPRHKTVVSLARLPDYVVKVVDEALKRGDASVLDDYVPRSSFRYLSSVVVGLPFVALFVLSHLSVTGVLRKLLTKTQSLVITALVVERIVAERPLSISALRRDFDGSPSHHVLGTPRIPSLNSWYSALDALEDIRETLLVELYKRRPSSECVFLYDITSTYFEGVKCPLAEFGYNRDGKKGKMQVVIGIICDGTGRPVWCEVFKGNTSDQTTVKDQLINLKDKLGVKEFIFVGDRGMVTHARIEELSQEGWWESFGYITALKRSELLQLVDDEEHPLQVGLFDHQKLVELEHDGERYVLCHNPHRKSEDAATRDRLLTLTEKKLESISQNVLAGRMKQKDKIARRLYRWVNRWGMERFFVVDFDEGRFEYRRDEELLERYRNLDGCYVIRARVKHGELSSEELVQQYKDLKYVEQAFRTMKTTELQTRPVRVWTEKHVRGLIFVCFLAYLATWEIKSRLADVLERDEHGHCEGDSLQEIYRSLSRITIGSYEIGGNVVTELSTVSQKNRRYLKALGVPAINSLDWQQLPRS